MWHLEGNKCTGTFLGTLEYSLKTRRLKVCMQAIIPNCFITRSLSIICNFQDSFFTPTRSMIMSDRPSRLPTSDSQTFPQFKGMKIIIRHHYYRCCCTFPLTPSHLLKWKYKYLNSESEIENVSGMNESQVCFPSDVALRSKLSCCLL